MASSPRDASPTQQGAGGIKRRPPKCEGCGYASPHVVLRVPGKPSQGHAWLCASCEYLRDNPEAALAKNPPGLPSTWPNRSKAKQKERLFDA